MPQPKNFNSLSEGEAANKLSRSLQICPKLHAAHAPAKCSKLSLPHLQGLCSLYMFEIILRSLQLEPLAALATEDLLVL